MGDNEKLAVLVVEGDNAALYELWINTRRFIASQARKYAALYPDALAAGGVTTEDLIQVGFFAMLDACRAWYYDRRYALLTYTSYHIKAHFADACGIRSTKRDPMHTADRTERELTDSGDSFTVGDTIPDAQAESALYAVEDEDYNENVRAAVNAALCTLDARQQALVKAHFFDGEPITQAGNKAGFSDGSGAMRRALRDMRRGKAAKMLEAFRADIIDQYAYKGGLNSFKNSGESSTERAAAALIE